MKPTDDTTTDVEKPLDPAAGTTGTDLVVVDFGEDAGKGMENVRADEYAIPFVRIIQSNSPQIDKDSPKFIPGAKVGDFLKTSTGEIFDGDKGFIFIPCHRDEQYVEYTPRDAGGGFVGIRAPDDELVVHLRGKQGKFGRLKTTAGTELTQTFNLYGLFVIPGADGEAPYVFRAIVAFASTQIKKYQGFMEGTGGIQYAKAGGGVTKPPMWAHQWHLISGPDQNKKGKFKGYYLRLANGATVRYEKGNPALPGPRAALLKPNEPLYIAAKEFYQAIEAGRVTIDRESDETAGGPAPDDDIPF